MNLQAPFYILQKPSKIYKRPPIFYNLHLEPPPRPFQCYFIIIIIILLILILLLLNYDKNIYIISIYIIMRIYGWGGWGGWVFFLEI